MKTRPPLLTPLGRAYGRAPYAASRALLQAGWIEAQRGAVQSVLDRTLGRIAPGRMRITALTGHLLVTLLHVPEMRSADPIDARWGYVPESDLALWALVTLETEEPAARQVFWSPLIMFVDDPAAAAGGREIFGFPKIQAAIRRTGSQPAAFGVEAEISAFTRPGRSRRVETVRILEVTGADGAASSEAEAGSLLDIPILEGLSPRLKLSLPGLGFPVLQMKQIPSLEDPGRAESLALVSAGMRAGAVHGAGILKAPPEIRIASPASLPLAMSLGTPPVQALRFAGWVVHDFETAPGRILAEWQPG